MLFRVIVLNVSFFFKSDRRSVCAFRTSSLKRSSVSSNRYKIIFFQARRRLKSLVVATTVTYHRYTACVRVFTTCRRAENTYQTSDVNICCTGRRYFRSDIRFDCNHRHSSTCVSFLRTSFIYYIRSTLLRLK